MMLGSVPRERQPRRVRAARASAMADEITRRSFLGATALIVMAPVAEAATAQAAAERRTLAIAIDRIIPAADGMPAASAAGVGAYIDTLARGDDEFRQRLSTIVAALGGSFTSVAEADQVAALAALQRDEPALFATLRDVVYEAYYSNPAIWPLIGYVFRAGAAATAPIDEFDARLLGRVRQLAPFYREPE